MAAQPMNADVRQPTPLVTTPELLQRVVSLRIDFLLSSQLLDGVRDLFVDFEYATIAVNKCSEPFEIKVPSLRLEPRAEMQGRT